MLARNAVWSAWLCLPASMATAQTLAVLPHLAAELERDDWIDLLRGMRWVLREREVVRGMSWRRCGCFAARAEGP